MGAPRGTARELPDTPGLHGPEACVSAKGGFPGFRVVVKNPLDFRTGEVGGHRQARFVPETVDSSLFYQVIADFVRSRTLPDNGMAVRPSRIPVPEDRGFPLVRDPYGRQILSSDPGFQQGLCDDLLRILPDFQRIVLHPPRFREYLFMFFLRKTRNVPCMIKNNKTSAGCPLVQRSHVSGHIVLPEKKRAGLTGRPRLTL